jgi:5-methylcytosine-specific restriction endonuclease McrA
MLGDVSDEHIKRERDKARELRQSRWWQTQLDKATCYYCGAATARKDATMDHVVPLGQGGYSTKGNCVVACKACNTMKRDMTAAEWALRSAAKPQHVEDEP